MLAYLDKHYKVIIFILLIILFIELVYFDLDDCSTCRFKINNTVYTFTGFYNLYQEDCLKAFNDFSSPLKAYRPHE
jgi:hypothetical protein